jgi:SAM-dependent methyltransferase
MDSALIRRLNDLWRPIYPYLAEWLSQWCPAKPSRILELGPFSGGISTELGSLFKNMGTVCLMSQGTAAQTIKEQFTSNIQILVGSLEQLPFVASFDLAVFRGAFFFLNPKMIKEAYRVLKPAGRALLGGGYGPLTPHWEIERIAEESKRLNYQLGKKWISKEELELMVKDAGLQEESHILQEGGLWLLIKKDFTKAVKSP